MLRFAFIKKKEKSAKVFFFFLRDKSAQVCWPVVKKVVITQLTINNYSVYQKKKKTINNYSTNSK